MTGEESFRRRGQAARASASGGVVYLALLLMIAGVGVVAAHAVQMGAVHGLRDAEEELLIVGEEFSRALERYAQATPAGLPRAPATLDELLRDPRYPGVVRHLRRIPSDPLTGRVDWVVARDAHGRILGLHSSSQQVPIRIDGPGRATPASGQPWKSHSEWVFWGPVRPPMLQSRDAQALVRGQR